MRECADLWERSMHNSGEAGEIQAVDRRGKLQWCVRGRMLSGSGLFLMKETQWMCRYCVSR